MWARDARLEVDQGAHRGAVVAGSSRWSDPGREQRSAPGRADPLAGPRDLEGRVDLDRAPEGGEPVRDPAS